MSERAAISDLIGICRVFYLGSRRLGDDAAADGFARAGQLLQRARRAHDRGELATAGELANEALGLVATNLPEDWTAGTVVRMAGRRLRASPS